MCTGCKSLTGWELDVYAGALTWPAGRRREYVELVAPDLLALLGPMLDEHEVEGSVTAVTPDV